MDNQVIQSFWYSAKENINSISMIEVMCIASYLMHDHIFHLYTYAPNDISMQFVNRIFKNHPKGYNFYIKDAREILDESEIFFDDRGSIGIAAFSDFFRFTLLYKKGGWWADMDTICLKHIDIQTPYAFASQREERGGGITTTCMLKAPRNSEMMGKIVALAREEIQSQKYNWRFPYFNQRTLFGTLANRFISSFCRSHKIGSKYYPFIFKTHVDVVPWGIIGPNFLHQFIFENVEYKPFVCPPHFFCEIDYWDAERFTKEIRMPSQADNYVLHLWNAMWEVMRLDKNSSYVENCIIEQLKNKIFLDLQEINFSYQEKQISFPLKITKAIYHFFKRLR